MKQFATPFAIKGTIDKLKHIEELLFELGYYRKDEYNNNQIQYIASGSNNTPIDELCLYSGLSNSVKREVINYSKENEELILALAAMVEGGIFHKGEYLKCTQDYSDQFTKGKLYKQRSDNGSNYYGSVIADDKGVPNGVAGFVKATKEEIIQHFNQKNMSDISGRSTGQAISQSVAKDTVKKIIGWNVKPGIDRIAALKSIGWEGNMRESSRNIELIHQGAGYKDAERLGVLSALFVPVYEEDKRSISIGNRTYEFHKDMVSYSYNTTIYKLSKSDIVSLIDLYNSKFTIAAIPYQIKTLVFGCEGQISIEMSDIVKIFNELNRE